METVCLRSSFLPIQPSSAKLRHRKISTTEHTKRYSSSKVIAGTGRDAHNRPEFDGRVVDENMIVLRKRIQEMKMVKQKNEPLSEWMDWEKQYYANYLRDIFEAVGLLQSQLMNARPSLGLGMMTLVTLSVLVSTTLALFQFMEIAKWALFGLHHLLISTITMN
uniref:Uncharacterized protein n=1 Tax=Nelumbo nucifera TaxID=4432 RepID=A0A822Z1Z7_NELNU|nr:TPA_asm: hypothetical protein HUJ06_006158 [Nelumbo nucifera]